MYRLSIFVVNITSFIGCVTLAVLAGENCPKHQENCSGQVIGSSFLGCISFALTVTELCLLNKRFEYTTLGDNDDDVYKSVISV